AGVYNDVWYTFNSGAYTSLNLTVNLGTAALIGVEFYTSCGTLATGLSLGGTAGNCDFNTNAPNPTVITGLTPNTTYRMRLFTNASYDTPGTFTTCLTIPPPPTVTVNSTSTCAGQSVTLTATPSSAGGTYLWSNGATTQTITVTPNATTSYSVTYSSNGTANGSGTVTVNPLPTINGGQDQTVCQGGSVTLSGTGGSSYSWDNGVSNGVAFVPNATTTYTVTGTDANGCTNTDQVVVTVNPIPVANAVTGQTLCAGTSTSAVTFTGTPGANFAWTNSSPTIGLASSGSGNIPSFIATNNTGSPVTATISVTPSLAGCIGTPQTFTYVVNSTPSAPNASNVSICAGQPATITASSLANWYTVPTGGVSIGQATSYTTPALNTTTTYYMEGVGGPCVSATRNAVTVTVNPIPNVTGNTVLCPNTTSQLTGSGTAAAWTSSNTAIATVSNTGLVTAVSFGTSTIAYTANTGCSTTVSINVTNPTTPTFNAINPICSGGALQLPVSSTNNIQGTWSPAINNTQTTTYTFTPSAGQCATTAQQTVVVNPNPTISGNSSLCSGATTLLSGSGTAAANNAWVSGTPANATVSNAGLVTGVNTGNTTITYTNSNGCTATQVITINANPTANAGLDQNLCAGGNVTLTGNATAGAAPYTYAWDNGIQNNVPFIVNATGTYTLTVTDANGCVGNDAVTITATSIDWANLQWPASGTQCLGQTHNVYGQLYIAGITNGPGPANGVVAQVGVNTNNTDPSTWPAGSWTSANFNTQVGNNDEYTASIGQLLSAGTYYYTFRYSLGQGCPFFYGGYNGGAWNGTSNTNGSLTINPAPNATTSASACDSYTWHGQTYIQSGTYTQTVPSGAGCDSVLYLNLTIHSPVTGPTTTETACESYTWNGQTYSQSGTYTYNGTTEYGCDSTVTLQLTINEAPSNASLTLAGGIFTGMATGANTYAWFDCGTNQSIPGETNLTFTPSVSGSYAFIAINGCGSDTSTCEPIEVQGIEESATFTANLYPNPTDDIVYITVHDAQIKTISIMDIQGKICGIYSGVSAAASLSLKDLARGAYLVSLETDKGLRTWRVSKN
ncbi:MAG: Ig-like domain-containing protein, partial [Flavobacteriales bacterium]